jgi:alginate O-acetyltransferase complex protein AlgJ
MSREEVARIEVGHTTVSPQLVRLLVAGFLTAIAVVPIVELASLRTSRAQGLSSAWSHLTTLPTELRSPTSDSAAPSQGAGSAWDRVVVANRSVLAAISRFESGLEDESLLGRTLRPPAQAVMTGLLGAGNERVYRGRDGWLFFRPDVEYLTGRGFLDAAELQRRVAAASEWEAPPQPDARLAIAGFQRDLDARRIRLVVVPTPVKPGVHPEKLSRRPGADGAGVFQNPSYREFLASLGRDRVLVFDPSETLAAERRISPQYLDSDTHWRPEAMEAVAAGLARFIEANVDLPGLPDPGYRIERQEVRNSGDIVRMLDLPAKTTMYSPEAVYLRRVLQADGSIWRPSREADVLVLGDSFSNIYALESLGWGTSAGFVEQVSYGLRRPVDRIIQNDQGAFATRAMLWRDPSRLDGKRVLVYQFAVRELAFGDWQILP